MSTPDKGEEMGKVEKHSESNLDTLAQQINEEHRAFIGSLKKTVEHGIRAGELLTRAKAERPHGTWLPWLSENFEGSERSAQVYMQMYRNRNEIRAKYAESADLSISGALKEIASHGDTTAPQRPADMPPDEFRVYLQAHEDGLEDSCGAMGVDLERIARYPENERRGWVAQAAWESMIEQGRRYAELMPDPEFPELNNLTPEYLTEILTQAEKLRWWVRQVEWLESIVRACDWPPGRGMPEEAFNEIHKNKPLSNLYNDGNGNGLPSPRGHLREWLGDVV